MDTNQDQETATLQGLTAALQEEPGFPEVIARLINRQSVSITGAWGSACALTVAAIADRMPSTTLVVLPRMKDVDEFALDLESFTGLEPSIFPAWEALPQEQDVSDAIFGKRLRVLNELDSPQPPRVIITSFPALLQKVPSRADRRQSTHELRVGEELEIEEFLTWLRERGFEEVPAVELPGEFSTRGGIVDVFPPDALDPLRVEFFGEEIESLRRFDVETQRKIEELHSASLTILAPLNQEKPGGQYFQGEHFLDSLPPDSVVLLTELQEMIDEARLYLGRLDDKGDGLSGLYSTQHTLAECARFGMASLGGVGMAPEDATCNLSMELVERFTGPRQQVLGELAGLLASDERVLIACHNEGELQRLRELLADSPSGLLQKVELCLGFVQRGFRWLSRHLVIVSDHELFGRTALRSITRRKRRRESRLIDSFVDLKEGDLVVHATKGIARYRGMKLLEKGEQVEEHLVLEFAGNTRIYVPSSLIHLVQKYIGVAKTAPTLSKINSNAWEKKKEQVSEAVADMASEMLMLQASRESKPGIAYPPDTDWMNEFEAAFPYTETGDQLHAIHDIKVDMEKSRPMDRLICGDVGYGKTEVAMRAAFKAIEAGKQVAVLVPTTVLAEQHYRTFSERMAEFPFTIASLSRFRTKGEQQEILRGLEIGSIDLVIGTHRLVQSDVRFKDLGLLIIDEEQRFGVQAKERLKLLRLEIDVLTMTATPIPRTLHLSLLGIRDISSLETAPQDRQAVETKVVNFSKDLIRRAIVRELNRNGQIYFVHNRVQSIEDVAAELQSIVPELRISIGHGQMNEHQLEEAMMAFVSGESDCLLCTTIIENGLDIPNANTMFINQAQNFGLATLHQLRGRVGRYRHRAYCYLLLDPRKPLTPNGSRRLRAIEEYSDLGAGFKIAMQDLEIRGAGNILGTEQSGHISSVGYEMYCQLLENAVRGLKHLPKREHPHVDVDLPISAFLPDNYVPRGRHKVEIYRRLAVLEDLGELQHVREELEDRYGPVPVEAERLLRLKRLQLIAWSWDVETIYLEDRYAVFRYKNASKMAQLGKRWKNQLRIVDARRAYWPLDNPKAIDEALLSQLEAVLRKT